MKKGQPLLIAVFFALWNFIDFNSYTKKLSKNHIIKSQQSSL